LLEAPRGIVSTYASRCDLTYSLGLISKGLYRDLETIGKIRNTFVHRYAPLALDDPQISNLVDLLQSPIIQHSVTVEGDNATHSSGPERLKLTGTSRDKLNAIVALIFNWLLITGLKTKHRERKTGW